MIRKAEIDDANDIRKLVHSLSHFYLEDSNASLPEWFLSTLEPKEFKLRLSIPEYFNLVYIESNLVIGYLSVKGGSHIYHLFVSEQHQQKGIASSLWKYFLDRTESKFFTVRSSIFAIPVYKSFGFNNSGNITSKDGLHFQAMELELN